MTSPSTFDAIVIGAGIFGCGIARELAARGLSTCNVDMNPGPGMGSTAASGAIIRFNYSTVDGVRMAWEGNRYWKNFADLVADGSHEHGVTEKVVTGLVFLRQHPDLLDLYARNLGEVGVPFDQLSHDEVLARYPFLSMANFGEPTTPDDEAFWAEPVGSLDGALSTPDAGYIRDPQLAAQNLHAATVGLGGVFRFGERVDEILTTADGSAVTGVELRSGEQIHAPVVINVGGPWSSSVNKLAGLEEAMTVRTQPMRHEAHVAPSPEGLDFEADGIMVTDVGSGIYFRPAPGNQVFVGSTDPECDGHDWVTDMDTLNRELTEPAWNRQMMRVARRMPSFGVPHRRLGLAEAYDVSSDWGPIYDRTDLDGFFVAIGTSGNQFKNACVASHLMAELVTEVSNGRDHDTDPLIVRGRFTDTPMNMGSFSRNRELNADSTNSVLG